MSSSGSVDFGSTRSNLIEDALRKCGVLREGVSASANQLTTGARALNIWIKSGHTDVMPLWAIKEGAVFPIAATSSVTLGPSGGHAATTWVHTQLAAAGASGATSLTVDSITGISASDNIGVELDDGTVHWTTVSGAPSGTTVVLTTGLASAAAIDSHVYTYTSKTVRPLKIVQASNFNYTDNTELPVNIISRDEWIRHTEKTSESATINEIYYDPQLTRGVLYFFPRFLNGDSIIKIWFRRPIEDMDAAGDTLDYPQEWEGAVMWSLAASMGYEFGVPERKQTMLEQKAAVEVMKAGEMGAEEGSVYLMPERRSR